MTKPNAKLDAPLPTASLSGTLILCASQLIEAHIPTDYQAVSNVLSSTAITFLAIHATRKLQALVHKRQVESANKKMLEVIESSVQQLTEIINTSEGSVKDRAEKKREELLHKKVDIISGKLNILALDAYVDPHPVHPSSPEPSTK